MTLDGINPRLAELLWDIHKTRELVPTLADDSTREQARQFIAEDETKFTRLCALALQINDVAFFDQVAYATQAMRDHPAKGEFVFNAWRECGNENALLADICRAVNERIYMDNRTVQDILGKLGLPAKKANTDPKSRTRRS